MDRQTGEKKERKNEGKKKKKGRKKENQFYK